MCESNSRIRPATDTTMRQQQQQRRTYRRRAALTLAATAAAVMTAPVDAFSNFPPTVSHVAQHQLLVSQRPDATQRQKQQRPTKTRREFRDNGSSENAPLNYAPSSISSSSSASPKRRISNDLFTSLRQPPPSFEASATSVVMPPWLLPQGGDKSVEERLDDLRTVMSSSDFTPEEISTVIHAVYSSSKGDLTKMAGAAHFAAVLVETMDMGRDALIAAAFHFVGCVEARESNVDYWDWASPERGTIVTPELRNYGEDVVRIGVDAARLKRAESVAASLLSGAKATGNMAGGAAANGEDSHAENLKSLLLSETGDWRALAIRSAGSLFRLRGLLHHRDVAESTTGVRQPLSPTEVSMAREALHIYAPLASRMGMHRLKNELEGAAFKFLYRRQHGRVMELYDRDTLEPILAQIKNKVGHLLDDDKPLQTHVSKLKISARIKEPYSLWKKMLRTNTRSVLSIPDALALRVVLDAKSGSEYDGMEELVRAKERALCYYVQKICTDTFRPNPIDGRFKDYIGNPKPNGYQSLHYTASVELPTSDDDEEADIRPVEIQVRSGEMHRVAEYGLAAHWEYKAVNKDEGEVSATKKRRTTKNPAFATRKTTSSSDSYLRSVQRWYAQQQPEESSQQDVNDFVEQGENNILSTVATGGVLNESEIREGRTERLRARAERLAPYIEALRAARFDLAREQVFVFFSSDDTVGLGGKIMSLPSGACVLDAVREAERQFGGDGTTSSDALLRTVRHNGAVPLTVTQRLRNGDVLLVGPWQ